MNISQLIEIVRTDYLDDNARKLWSDDFFLRAFLEAERQASSRSKLIYDDSSSEYTSIPLTDGKYSYTLSQKINWIEYLGIDGVEVKVKSKRELDRTVPTWRTLRGIKGNPVNAIIRGRQLRLSPYPDASLDATYIQSDTPSSASTGETWYDSTNELLYVYSSGWTLSPNAALGTLSLECFRGPEVDSINLSYEPEIPAEFHRDLIYWVLHEAYKKQDSDSFDQERGDYYLARFVEIFGRLVPAEVRLNLLEEDKSLILRPIAYTATQTIDDSDEF